MKKQSKFVKKLKQTVQLKMTALRSSKRLVEITKQKIEINRDSAFLPSSLQLKCVCLTVDIQFSCWKITRLYIFEGWKCYVF